MLLRLLCLVLLACSSLVAEKLTPGETYTLELADGSRLHSAVYRGVEAGVDSFELASVVGRVRLKEYRVARPPAKIPWMLAIAPGYELPLNQKELGFTQGLAIHLTGSAPLFGDAHLAIPRVVANAGFSRYSGSKALLSGPELALGPGWLLPLGTSAWFALFHLTAGTAFYELLNVNLNQTFTQTTFVANAELGFGRRMSGWGITCSYVQSYLYDEKLPLVSGGVSIGAVYFGGNA